MLKRLTPKLAPAGAIFFGLGLCAMTVHAADRNQVLALVGTHPITENEVNKKLGSQVTAIKAQIYALKERAIRTIAADYVLQQAAQKAHLSVADYLKREVDDKIGQPSDAEVRQAYAMFQRQAHYSYAAEKEGMARWLIAQRRSQLRAALLSKLVAEEGFQMLLPTRLNVPTENHPALGPRTARVTIAEFGDFQDPFTRKAEDTLKQIRDKYGRKVRIVFLDYPLEMIHRNSREAANAARCAGEQGKFWPYHDALLADQTKLTPADLKATAARLKLNSTKFDSCLDQHKYQADIQSDIEEATVLAVEGTPMFYLNGRPLFGAATAQDFDRIIDQELSHRRGEVATANR